MLACNGLMRSAPFNSSGNLLWRIRVGNQARRDVNRCSREHERSCGSCTACCDGWLQIEVRGHQVRPGKPCPFSVQHGCSIYSERPQHPCREFVCGWLVASSPLPDWMRPDKSDLIMLAANFVWHGLPVDVVVAAGARPKKKALDWLMKFSTEKSEMPDLSNQRRMVCVWSAGIPGRNLRTDRPR